MIHKHQNPFLLHHQSLEAKERIEIQDENQTLATITLQNYFRLYKKLSGMTGTAMTEASEFMQIYKLGVIPIPTNKKMQRIDQSDLIYKSEVGKFTALAIIAASRSCCLAFNTSCAIPRRFRIADSSSDFSTLTVPTNTGCPFL